MAEWLKAHAWKACLGETLTWVRIPLSPPFFFSFRGKRGIPTRRKILKWRSEFVTVTRNCLYHFRPVAELFTKRLDHGIDHVAAHVVFIAPDVANQSFASHGFAFAFAEIMQDRKLELGEWNPAVIDDQLPCLHVQRVAGRHAEFCGNQTRQPSIDRRRTEVEHGGRIAMA